MIFILLRLATLFLLFTLFMLFIKIKKSTPDIPSEVQKFIYINIVIYVVYNKLQDNSKFVVALNLSIIKHKHLSIG